MTDKEFDNLVHRYFDIHDVNYDLDYVDDDFTTVKDAVKDICKVYGMHVIEEFKKELLKNK